MKKIYTISLLLVIITGLGLTKLHSQTFSVTPIKPDEKGLPGSYIEPYAEVKNLTSSPITIRIQRERNDLPPGWSTYFCLEQCWAPETSDVEDVLEAGKTSLLKVTFGTSSTPGRGETDFVLSLVSNPSEKYSVSFSVTTSLTSLSDRNSNPSSVTLAQNYPNPFSVSEASISTIGYTSPRNGRVTLRIYNLLGREVRTLINEVRPAGVFNVTWDARDNRGNLVPTGIYIYKISSRQTTVSRRMLVTR